MATRQRGVLMPFRVVKRETVRVPRRFAAAAHALQRLKADQMICFPKGVSVSWVRCGLMREMKSHPIPFRTHSTPDGVQVWRVEDR